MVKLLDPEYTRLQRVVPGAIERPRIGAKPIGSLGRPTLIQELKGSHLPLETDPRYLLARDVQIQNEINRSRFYNTLYDHVKTLEERGIDTGFGVHASYEQVLAKSQLSNQLKEIASGKARLTVKTRGAKAKVRVAGHGVKETTQAAITATREELVKVLKTSDAGNDAVAAVGSLKRPEMLDIAKWFSEDGSAPVPQVIKKWANRSVAHREALGQLDNLKVQMQQIANDGKAIRTALGEVEIDPVTGRQLLTGPVRGVLTKLEVPPEFARVVQGLGREETSILISAMREVTRIPRMFWTGPFNPYFMLKTMTFYDSPIGVINSANSGRVLLSPSGYKETLKALSNHSEFLKNIYRRGGQMPTASLNPVMGSGAGISKIAKALGGYRRGIQKLDSAFGFPARAGRVRPAKAAFDTARKAGKNDEEAWAEAVYAWNNVMPNYARAANVARSIDAVIPYFQASIAGTRALGIAVRRRPVATLSKAAVIPAVGTLVALHNLQTEKGEEFYQDMIRSKKEYLIDNNMAVVMPNASKDKKTGKWSGIWLVPIPPEFRGMNKMVWSQARDWTNEQKISPPSAYARAMFDTVTGQSVTNDPRQSVMKNLLTLPGQNPGINIALGLGANYDVRNLAPVVDPESPTSPSSQTEQFLLRQLGTSGKLFQGDENILDRPLSVLKGQYINPKGVSSGYDYRLRAEDFRKGLNPNEKQLFDKLTAPKKDAQGNQLTFKLTKTSDYADLLSNPDLFTEYSKWQKSFDGHDPLWDLDSGSLRSYMQAQVISKYNPGGDSNTVRQLYNRLPKDFFSKRDKFFADLKASGTKLEDKDYKPRPQMPDTMAAWSDEYHKLPYGTGQRSAALRSKEGQAYIAWLDQNRMYNNEERADLGLPPLEDPSQRFGFSNRKKSAGSAYKYAVSLSAGGKSVSPRVSVQKTGGIRGKARMALGKPKVTLTKSKV